LTGEHAPGSTKFSSRRSSPCGTAVQSAFHWRSPSCAHLSPKAYRPGSPVVQLRVPKDTLARLDDARGGDTRSAWVLRLIDRELDGQVPAAKPAAPVADSPAGPLVLPPGEPCPGVACSGAGCWNRDTARYGLRRLVLCTACASALQGQTHKREVPETAARTLRRGAA
jgi:hypothetical protein